MRTWLCVLCVAVPLPALAGPWHGDADVYLGASHTDAIYSSHASGDFGITLIGSYEWLAVAGEYEYGDSDRDTSHYGGALAGVAVPVHDRLRVFALAGGGYHQIDKGYTFGSDGELSGTSVSGDTSFGFPYAGGQLRLQIAVAGKLAIDVIAHARFDLDHGTAEVMQKNCVVVFCSTPTTKTYDVGGTAIGGALGIGYAF